MATARKIANAEEARRCLDKVAESGRKRADWARSNGIDARSLNAWRLILARSERQVPTRWVELVAAQPAAMARYVLRVGDVAVEVGDDFQDDTLRRLLAVVTSCCTECPVRLAAVPGSTRLLIRREITSLLNPCGVNFGTPATSHAFKIRLSRAWIGAVTPSKVNRGIFPFTSLPVSRDIVPGRPTAYGP